MNQPITAIGQQTSIAPLPRDVAARLASALGGETSADDVTVFVDGTTLRLPDQARDAVVELLRRLASGEGVEMHSSHAWLTTAQAAKVAGISQTYLRNLSDAETIPCTYRGTHRRFKESDVLAWVAQHK